ncbi:hypothetical protein MTO96_012095 [Rhipicephalus appendiculatus]
MLSSKGHVHLTRRHSICIGETTMRQEGVAKYTSCSYRCHRRFSKPRHTGKFGPTRCLVVWSSIFPTGLNRESCITSNTFATERGSVLGDIDVDTCVCHRAVAVSCTIPEMIGALNRNHAVPFEK